MELQVTLAKKKGLYSAPPPPPAAAAAASMFRRKSTVGAIKSVTKDSIERYWREKKMEEDEHMLAALKAAARIRARALSEEDYRRFEESLRDVIKRASGEKDENNTEMRVGIKDWWTKSKYAYLNQPATRSVGDDAGKTKVKSTNSTSTYVPHMICSYSPAPSHSVSASLGVF